MKEDSDLTRESFRYGVGKVACAFLSRLEVCLARVLGVFRSRASGVGELLGCRFLALCD